MHEMPSGATERRESDPATVDPASPRVDGDTPTIEVKLPRVDDLPTVEIKLPRVDDLPTIEMELPIDVTEQASISMD